MHGRQVGGTAPLRANALCLAANLAVCFEQLAAGPRRRRYTGSARRPRIWCEKVASRSRPDSRYRSGTDAGTGGVVLEVDWGATVRDPGRLPETPASAEPGAAGSSDEAAARAGPKTRP
jgi:hypothetical protein